MGRYGYPPSHRRVDDPQPEVCDVCGLLVGGAHLRTSHISGLEGRQVCQYHHWRSRLTKADIDEIHPGVGGMVIAGDKVYEPGAEPWWFTVKKSYLVDNNGNVIYGSDGEPIQVRLEDYRVY